MAKLKIFISGVQKELSLERYSVKDFIEKDPLYKDIFNVFLFEKVPAKGSPSERVYEKAVNECDVYLGIWGYEYGRKREDGISSSDWEYRIAKSRDQEVELLIFIKGAPEKDKNRQPELMQMIETSRDRKKGSMYKRFESETIEELL